MCIRDRANKTIGSFASNAARLGSMLTFGITAPLAALGKTALSTFVEFEDGMMKVKAVTGATDKEFQMLNENAKELGKTTRFTAQQFADLQLVLGRKGFDPQAIKDMTSSVAKLALATGSDLSLSAEVVASSINAFNLESTEAASVANTLASAAANSSIELATFSTAFGHAGASANAVGVDLQELAAMMGVLMDNGIKASKAGTGLRKIFMKLHEEGSNFTEVLDLVTQGEVGLERAMNLTGVTSASQLLILANNKDKVAENQSNINNLVGKFLDTEGNVTDTKGYHKAIYAADNVDRIATHFYEQGKADAVKDVVNKSKNLSPTKARTQQGEVFVNGLKVKAISGADSSKLKIKTRKFNN